MIVETPTLLLKRKDFSNIGAIPASEISYKNNFNSYNELSFKVYKYKNGVMDSLWDEINTYNVIYIPEYNEFFDIDVSLTEDTWLYKTVKCRSLAESELSQINLYDMEINTEEDIVNSEYETLFYRGVLNDGTDLTKYSLLHRILEKAPHYEIGHIDETLKKLKSWYTFSISDKNIYDVLTGEISETYQCLFIFEIKPDGTRFIHAYDLCNTCRSSNCGYRGDFYDVCPKCGGTNFGGAYGKDTTILISKDNLSSSVSVDSNNDDLKNCFRVSGGDELMTATVINCSPTMDNYFWNFSSELLNSMPQDLVNHLQEYVEDYDKCINTDSFPLNPSSVSNYNEIVTYVNSKFNDSTYKKIQIPMITGYHNLVSLQYDLSDLMEYITHSMMPVPSLDGQGMEQAIWALNHAPLTSVAISDINDPSVTAINNAIKGMAKTYINTALFKIMITDDNYTYNKGSCTWIGKITIKSLKDDTQKETNEIIIAVNSNVEFYLKQKLDRIMAKYDNSIIDITDMRISYDNFCDRIKYYSINYLSNTMESYEECMTVISTSNNKELYTVMMEKYETRYNKLQEQISCLEKYEKRLKIFLDEILKYKECVKNRLNLELRLGTDLWKAFLSYRREYNYKNDDFVSDGLNNVELVKRASQLIDDAKKELYKASHLQYSINASLNDLLALKEFQPIVNDFECGNWIRMMVDEQIYFLRLLSYQIFFDDLSSISVDFSTVERLWSGDSDLKSILDSTSSISSSYSATLSKVNHLDKTSNYVDNWIKKGLDATATKIVNNADNQDIVIDRNGILCRKYDDLTDSYDPQQIKIISNGLYLMDYSQNQNTVKTGIGKFIYLDPKHNFEERIGYGVIADVITSNIVLTEEVGVYSPNGSVSINGDGITIKPSSQKYSKSDYIFKIIDENGAITIGADSNGNATFAGTIYANAGEFKGAITGGYLNIKNQDNKRCVIIDPSQLSEEGYIFKVTDKNGNVSIGADSNGNAYFKGQLSAATGTFSGSLSSSIIYLNSSSNENRGCIMLSDFIERDEITYKGIAIINDYANDSEDLSINFGFKNTDTSKRYYTAGFATVKRSGKIFNKLYANTYFNNGSFITGSFSDYDGAFISDSLKSPRIFAGDYVHGDYVLDVNGESYFSNKIHFYNNSYVAASTLGGLYFSSNIFTQGAVSVGNIDPGTNMLYVNGTSRFTNNVVIETDLTVVNSVTATSFIGTATKAIDATNSHYLKSPTKDGISYTCILTSNGNFRPHQKSYVGEDGLGELYADGIINLGTKDCRWDNVYAVNDIIQTSDFNAKNHISPLTNKHMDFFLNLLPVSFTFKNGKSGRTHIGFISQDVETAMVKTGLTDLDFAGFCKDLKIRTYIDENGNEIEETVLDENGNPVYMYSLRYSEFVAIITYALQKTIKSLDETNNKLKDLSDKYNELSLFVGHTK